MKKRLVLEPHGWPCSLLEAPPGPILFHGDHLGFKSEYKKCEAFNYGGEYLCIADSEMVQPVKARWEEYDDT